MERVMLSYAITTWQRGDYAHARLPDIITGSIARSASLPVFNLLRGRSWGATRCTDGVKFGMALLLLYAA